MKSRFGAGDGGWVVDGTGRGEIDKAAMLT